MKKKSIVLTVVLTLGLGTVIFGGTKITGNSGERIAESKTSGQNSMQDKSQPPASQQLPFNAIVIRHTVADYNKWRPFFDADSLSRKTAGMHLIGIARGIEAQNDVELPFMIDDVQKAKAFSSSPKLKEVMQKAGVNSAPNIKFIKVLRMTEALQKPGDYVEVTHKVNNFDAWLKVFDGEGPAARAKDGLEDGVLARGIDDPNLVYLVFKITDLSKAKAALADPARKKIMMEAGVIGKPEVYFGRDQQ
jgi:hypothetical protein